jgi:choice-of-anchor C domain-containing protein
MSRTLTLLALAAIASSANAGAFTNGSFEDGPAAGTFVTLSAGDTSITGWTVGGTTIDYIGSYWQSSDGVRNVDLNGSDGLGSIEQTFDTIANTWYTVTFDLAGNPDGPPVTKSVAVSADSQSNTYAFDTTGATLASMNWSSQTFRFLADDASATLKFSSLDDTFYGGAIDNVSVEAVPEPASMAALGLGLAAVARRRRNK